MSVWGSVIPSYTLHILRITVAVVVAPRLQFRWTNKVCSLRINCTNLLSVRGSIQIDVLLCNFDFNGGDRQSGGMTATTTEAAAEACVPFYSLAPCLCIKLCKSMRWLRLCTSMNFIDNGKFFPMLPSSFHIIPILTLSAALVPNIAAIAGNSTPTYILCTPIYIAHNG